MQFRIYDRQTLIYKDGGYVSSYIIDDDYIVNNNSTIKIIKELNDKVSVGDTIALIKTSGAYHKGTITTIDNADHAITYKADKELFNDNMLNPLASKYAGDSEKESNIAGKFGITEVANILDSYFGKSNDWARRLPIKLITEGDVEEPIVTLEKSQDSKVSIISFNKDTYSKQAQDFDRLEFVYSTTNIIEGWGISDEDGFRIVDLERYGITTLGTPKHNDKIIALKSVAMLWTWNNESINVVDWLVELFKNYNVSLSWTINFDSAKENLKERQPYYIVTLSAINNTGKIIKDNAKMQTITYTEKKLPDSSVCIVLDNDSKEIVKLNSGTKNLLNPNIVEENKFLTVEYNVAQLKDDETSNVSGYIKLNIDNTFVKDGINVTLYTLSFKNSDLKKRRIVFYDEGKNVVKFPNSGENWSFYLEYSPNGDGEVNYTISLHDKKVAYCRICYSKNAEEVQFEKGSVNTEYEGWNIPAIYYLCEKNGKYFISLNPDEHELATQDGQTIKKTLRVFPAKTVIVKYKESDDSASTPQQVAESTLIPSKFNQAIEIQTTTHSRMIDFSNIKFGDVYKIINAQGTIESNYTGRREDSQSGFIRLYFGLGRQNYTDLMQLRMQKQKYEVVYS